MTCQLRWRSDDGFAWRRWSQCKDVVERRGCSPADAQENNTYSPSVIQQTVSVFAVFKILPRQVYTVGKLLSRRWGDSYFWYRAIRSHTQTFSLSGSNLSIKNCQWLIRKQANHTVYILFLSSARVQCINRTRKPGHNINKVKKNNWIHVYSKNWQIR